MASIEEANLLFKNLITYEKSVVMAKKYVKYHKEVIKDLKRLEKLEKAIEILKDKKVSIGLLLKNNTLNQYNRVRHLYDADFLIQEEYELLKEVFGNE